MFSIAKTNVNWSHHACGHRPHIQNDKTKKEAKKKHEQENATHDHFARLECRGVDTASCRANHVLALRVEKSYSL